jgi:pimeloyl-ACP methyl ester carboxylesterase
MTAIKYRYEDVDGLKVFYREAGHADASALLLLHGFPSASHMFRDLIPLLADRFHIIAPDLPGFGQSEMPARSKFSEFIQPTKSPIELRQTSRGPVFDCVGRQNTWLSAIAVLPGLAPAVRGGSMAWPCSDQHRVLAQLPNRFRCFLNRRPNCLARVSVPRLVCLRP